MTRATTMVGGVLLLAVTCARAQEPELLDAAAARERAAAFLTRGDAPPRPDLRPAELEDLQAVPVEDRVHGPAFDLLLRRDDGRLRLLVRVDRAAGRVTYFSQPERDCVVLQYAEDRSERPAEERAEEARARALFDRAALRARALAFMGHLVPEVAAGARRFEVVHEREERDGLLFDHFVLVEAPGPGVLACHENLAQLDLNPETGEVVSMRRTDLRHEVREAPPVDAEAALRAARARLGGAGAVAAPRLVVLPGEQRGTFRVLWVVTFPDERVVGVDARDGRVIVP